MNTQKVVPFYHLLTIILIKILIQIINWIYRAQTLSKNSKWRIYQISICNFIITAHFGDDDGKINLKNCVSRFSLRMNKSFDDMLFK